jgi:hypothetical protein
MYAGRDWNRDNGDFSGLFRACPALNDPYHPIASGNLSPAAAVRSRDGAQETPFARKDLCQLPPAVRMATEMGAGLGTGPLLLRPVSRHRGAASAVTGPGHFATPGACRRMTFFHCSCDERCVLTHLAARSQPVEWRREKMNG